MHLACYYKNRQLLRNLMILLQYVKEQKETMEALNPLRKLDCCRNFYLNSSIIRFRKTPWKHTNPIRKLIVVILLNYPQCDTNFQGTLRITFLLGL